MHPVVVALSAEAATAFASSFGGALGEAAGNELASLIFGSDDDNGFAEIEKKLDEVISKLVHLTAVVEDLPNVIFEKFDQEALTLAYERLESIYDIFGYELEVYGTKVPGEILLQSQGAIKKILRTENRTEYLLQLPEWIEKARRISPAHIQAKLFERVERKATRMIEAQRETERRLDETFTEAMNLFASPYVVHGEIQKERPFIRYTMAPKRFKTVTGSSSAGDGGEGQAEKWERPDNSWNHPLAQVSARLQVLSATAEKEALLLTPSVVLTALVSAYRDAIRTAV